MILDFEEYKKKAEKKDVLQAISQDIGIKALIDITQEINIVLHFLDNTLDGEDMFSIRNPEDKELLIMLVQLCEFYGSCLKDVSQMAARVVGEPSIEEIQKGLDDARAIAATYEEQNETFVQKYVNEYLSFLSKNE